MITTSILILQIPVISGLARPLSHVHHWGEITHLRFVASSPPIVMVPQMVSPQFQRRSARDLVILDQAMTTPSPCQMDCATAPR